MRRTLTEGGEENVIMLVGPIIAGAAKKYPPNSTSGRKPIMDLNFMRGFSREPALFVAFEP